jgi:septum formation topological specificity factor MinE
MSSAKKWNWLHKDFILSMLTKNKRQQQRVYRQFIKKEDTEEISLFFERKNLPSVLGSERFIDWVKKGFFRRKSHEEVPESRSLAPDREEIKQVVCKTYHVDEEDLLKSKRGIFNEPRNVAVYLTRQLRGDGLGEICKEFQMKRYSTASSAIERVKIQILKDRRLRKQIEKLRLILTKSQT